MIRKHIAQYQKAIEFNPKFAGFYDSFSLALKAQGRNDEAEKQYRKARQMDKIPAKCDEADRPACSCPGD